MTPLIQIAVALVVTAIAALLVNKYVPLPERIKPVVNVVLWLIIVGIGLWLINTYIPMAGAIRVILNLVVVATTCVWVLQAVGLWHHAVRLWRSLLSHRSVG